MSTQLPRIEARVSAQERMQTILHARIEELSEDITESFKQQAAYQVQLEQKIGARFDKVDARFNEIEAKMATKEDIAALEKRVLSVEQGIQQILQQLVTIALKLE